MGGLWWVQQAGQEEGDSGKETAVRSYGRRGHLGNKVDFEDRPRWLESWLPRAGAPGTRLCMEAAENGSVWNAVQLPILGSELTWFSLFGSKSTCDPISSHARLREEDPQTLAWSPGPSTSSSVERRLQEMATEDG